MCRHKTRADGVPTASVASTNAVLRSRSTSPRVTRAKIGAVVIPNSKITLSRLRPTTAATTITNTR
jgi:hypothetical protein